MKRKILLGVCASFFAFSTFNNANAGIFPVSVTPAFVGCSLAPLHSASKSTFCSGFTSVVSCNCMQKINNKSICSDTHQVFVDMWLQYSHNGSNWLYNNACAGHPGVSQQECTDQWSCFMFGLQGSAQYNVPPPSDGECFGQTTNVAPC